MSEDRITWSSYFMMQAAMLASRSTCDRLNVGTVVVKDGRLIASGYNGSVSGTPHCNDVGHYMVDGHCLRAVHAEQNALMQMARMGISAEGAEIYVTDFPCIYCTKLLLQAGIQQINYLRPYHNNEFAMTLIQERGVQLRQIPLHAEDLAKVHLERYIASEGETTHE